MKTIVTKRRGTCASCGATVEIGKGFACLTPTGWRAYCTSSQCLPPDANVPSSPCRKLTAEGHVIVEPFDRDALPLLRSFPGQRWDGEAKVRTVSLGMGDRARVLELADQLGLDVDPSLRVVKHDSSIKELVDHAIKTGAYPFQIQAVKWLAPRKRALLADDMGVGKTIEALLSLPKDSCTIVICIASAKWNWYDEVKIWRPDLTPRVLTGKVEGASLGHIKKNEIVITNYDILPTWLDPQNKQLPDDILQNLRSCTLVVDECQKVKNYKTQRSKKAAMLGKLAARTWFLTGTPLQNKPFDLWGVLKAGNMAQDVFGWFTFLKLFGGIKGQFGGYEFANVPDPEVAERLRTVMLRRTKEEVLPDLPPKTRTVTRIDLPKKIKRQLDDLWDKHKASILDGILPAFEDFSETRAELAKLRIPAMLDIVETYEEQSVPLVVFSAHRAPIDTLGNRDGWVKIVGGMQAYDRHEAIQQFQRGEAKGIALTIGAGGEGITLTASSNMLFVDLDWSPAANLQAEDRVRRIGQKAGSINITRMVSNHDLDTHILVLLAKKQQLISVAIDGKVDYSKPKAKKNGSGLAVVQETREQYEERRRTMLAAAEEAERAALAERIGHNDWLGRERGKSNRPEPILTPTRVIAVQEAFRYMMSVCDGAKAKDDVGFGKSDANVARILARAGLDNEDRLRIAERMLSRYHRQLHSKWPILFVGNKGEEQRSRT